MFAKKTKQLLENTMTPIYSQETEFKVVWQGNANFIPSWKTIGEGGKRRGEK